MPRLGWFALVPALAACNAGGAPANYVGGKATSWALPLVGPLEDNVLLTPVLLDGVGPYLFAIDPDANVSIVDEQVVKDGRLAVAKGPARIDEAGVEQTRFYADVHGVELGSLVVEHVTAMIVKAGALDANGRRVHGVIGRDVLADQLVFSFDRDRGVAELTLDGSFKPSPDAIELAYTPLRAAGASPRPVDRRIVTATVHGEPLAMHVDLGAATSQLREARWADLGLTATAGHGVAVDEVGSRREVSTVAVADDVRVGRAAAPRVVFEPYTDQRFPAQPDGSLGLDFFRGYDVAARWDKHALYLWPRTDVPAADRIARWEVGALGKCQNPGCISARLVDPLAGKPADPAKPHPGVVLSVTREEIAGGMDLEVVLEAKGRPELPRIVVNLSPSADRVLGHLKPEWVGAELVTVDASPFARACPQAGGCIDLLAR